MNRKNPVILTLFMAFAFVGVARADDTDIYLINSTNNATAPNVLIVIDNAASNDANITNTCDNSGNDKLHFEACIINQVLGSSVVGTNINIGLELFNGATPLGGYIAYAVRNMTSTNKANLMTAVANIQKRNGSAYGLSMYEAWLYFHGLQPYAGTASGVPYDPAAVSSSGNYVSPVSANCQKNYIIFIGNGTPDSSKPEGSIAQNALGSGLGSGYPPGVNGNTTMISITPTKFESNWLDEYARALFGQNMSTDSNINQNIVTYTIDFETDSNPPTLAAAALLNSAAYQGGTGQAYIDTSASQLAADLKTVFQQIQAVNSVFAAVTLPVSVNVRGTYLNQVYMGVFRPDANAYPRWWGNLKEYELAVDNTTSPPSTYLADVNGNPVANNSTGFVNPGVTSWWTQNSSFWGFVTPQPYGVGGASDLPDGDLVEKGAEAEWLRNNFATTTTQANRQLYTCTAGCTANSLLKNTPFATSNTNITQAATGTTSSTDLQNLITWVRGQDLFDENLNGVTTDVRASIHGDVLHSRPAVINYGGTTPQIYVFYGGNDGIFHAIKGGQDSTAAVEQWGFIAPEFFGRLLPLYCDDGVPPGTNNLLVDCPSTPPSYLPAYPPVGTNPRRPNFMDGPIGVYESDPDNDGALTPGTTDKVYLYVGMRRGGRFLYALDVTDPTNPAFLWKHSNADLGYGELGQTWSLPNVARVYTPSTQVYPNLGKIRATSDPVIIMGAGYDSNANDIIPPNPATMGRGVMVIDALNGNVIWQVGPAPSGATYNVTVPGMTYSIPADLTVLDTNADGYLDRVYAADTGGNIWRIDINDASPANWQVTLLASLGNTPGQTPNPNGPRKFLYPPDVVLHGGTLPDGTTQTYDALLIGSGDREHPFDTTITNRFYMIEDPNTGLSVPSTFNGPITESSLYDATSDLLQTGTSTQQAQALTSLQSSSGWYITLGTGEKVVGAATTMSGTVYFPTNQPSPSSTSACNNLGIARLYELNYANGTATVDNNGDGVLTASDRYETLPGGGFPPSPVPVVVDINGQPVQAVISGTQVQTPPSQVLGKRYRTYWHNNLDR